MHRDRMRSWHDLVLIFQLCRLRYLQGLYRCLQKTHRVLYSNQLHPLAANASQLQQLNHLILQ